MLTFDVNSQVIDVPDKPNTKRNAIAIITSHKSFIVFAKTPEVKKIWLGHLKKAIALQLTKRSRELTAKSQSDSFLAPVYVGVDASSECMLCQQSFNVVRRRHHCRRCGKLVSHPLTPFLPYPLGLWQLFQAQIFSSKFGNESSL
jgi:hypothetical protein